MEDTLGLPHKRKWESLPARGHTAGDVTPANMQWGALNFVHLGPFKNTNHPNGSGGGVLERRPSKMIRDVQFPGKVLRPLTTCQIG